MTAFEQFDPFEQRITAAIDEIAAARRPDYLDDVFHQTRRTSQRPRWSFVGRWLPFEALATRTPSTRIPVRPLVLLLLALLLATAVGAAVVGSLNRRPPPFGLADNGVLGYPQGGDLYVRDSLTAEPRLLIGGPEVEQGPWFSPDGTRILFTRSTGTQEHLWTALADGSEQRQILSNPLVGGNAVWAPDSLTIAVINETGGLPTLSVVDAETGRARQIDLGDVHPLGDLAFRPPDGSELVVRVALAGGGVDLLIVPLDGSVPRPLGLPSELLDGQQWDNGGPAWSLDGQRIAYNRVEADPVTGIVHFRVHTVDADGTHDVALPGPTDPSVHEAWPAWSPDGKWILVHRWTWKTQNGGQGWVAVLPTDGSAPARDIGPRIPGGEDTGLIKTWSPDGTRVLVRAENTRQVFSVDPLTGETAQLTWTEELPDWQRVTHWP